MSQIEVTKLVPYVITGSNDDEIAVSKVVAYLILEPGTIEAGDTTRQSHINAFVKRRG